MSLAQRGLAIGRSFAMPLIVAGWLLGYADLWLQPASSMAWLALAAWGATHGLHNIEASSEYVTIAVTCLAVVGAVLRLGNAIGRQARLGIAQAGLFATCAPLGVLLPTPGAAFYISVVAIVSISGLWGQTYSRSSNGEVASVWRRFTRESFPVLAAGCFLTMSWQYNAQWLMRGLLVSAGVALVAIATVPLRKSLSRQMP